MARRGPSSIASLALLLWRALTNSVMPASKMRASDPCSARRLETACCSTDKSPPAQKSSSKRRVCSAARLMEARLLKIYVQDRIDIPTRTRSEEHTSELQSLMRISYAVFCLKKKNETRTIHIYK